MATVHSINDIQSTNVAAATSIPNVDIHVKGKDINPMLLLLMLQANSEDGKELLNKLSNAKTKKADEPLTPIYKPLTPIVKKQMMNIFLLLADVEEKNRKATQATQTAILASASESQAQYNAKVDAWQEAQTKANEAFEKGLHNVSTANWGNIWKDVKMALILGVIGALVVGLIVGTGGTALVAGLVVGGVVGAGVMGVVEGTDKKDFGSVTESHKEVDGSKQGAVIDAQTNVQIAQTKAQQAEQKTNTIMDSEFSPTQQTLSSIFTMYNAFVNWYGQLGQIFQGG